MHDPIEQGPIEQGPIEQGPIEQEPNEPGSDDAGSDDAGSDDAGSDDPGLETPPAPALDTQLAPVNPARPLLDAAAFDARLAEAGDRVRCFRQALESIGRELTRQFHSGVSANTLVYARAEAMDHLLIAAWRSVAGEVGPATALVAVGGFGRGELHPGSDVDLMILLDAEPAPGSAITAALERYVTFLWDIGLEIGHSVRTVAACVQQAEQDVTVATNLMEARLVHGDQRLFEAMRHATSGQEIWPSRAFFEAKLAEQSERHRRHHGSGYNLEPNVKEGPGGLRDIQMIGWVVKRHYGAETLAELVTNGFLTDSEYRTLIEGQSFLWRVRTALHLAAGRREDRLLFEYQREISAQFGFKDAEATLAVEQFMRQYYLTIMELSRLNEMLLELFQELFLSSDGEPRIVPINRRFQTRGGYLEVTSKQVFRRYPFALLELFLILQQNPEIQGVRASTIRLVRDHRYLIDEDFRNDLGCRSLFLEIIRQPRGITHEFRRMHTYGVLGAYLPVFGRIVGLMQFDLFHAYTVDEHILFTVRNLRQFAVPEHYHELPHCSDILPRLPKPELLYLGGLFQDIAKGRGGDHSELGAEAAIAFCRHHGISQYDAQRVAWLVRNHLIMSSTAQRQDISDPEVVRHFAARVGDTTRLDYLYLLTVADIRATNPDLWNDWKNSLLWDLYNSARRALRHGVANPVAATDLATQCREEARPRLFEAGIAAAEVADLWEHQSDDYFVRTDPDEVVWHTQSVLLGRDRELPLVAVRTGRRGTEIFLHTLDQDYLFAATCTILERLGLTVLDARIFTDANDKTYDSYIVLEATGEAIDSEAREREIQRTLERRLKEPEKAIYSASRVPRRQLRSFPIPPRVHFEEDLRHNRTIMEVVSADRPGLLSRVGWALASCHASVQTAKVSTFGERAEDVFFITDARKRRLSQTQCETLRANIIRALEPGRTRKSA